MGHIVYFYLETFDQCTEFTHSNGIKELYLDANGTQLCFVDNKSDVYIFDPINDAAVPVPDCPDNIDGILWDQNIFERAVFAVYNKSSIVTYIFVKYFVEGEYPSKSVALVVAAKSNSLTISRAGTKVMKISTTKLPSESVPLLMYSGEVTLSTMGSKLIQITLTSHEEVGNIVEAKKINEILNNQILCRR